MDSYIRNGNMISILEKVRSLGEESITSIISPRDPFGYDIRLPDSMKIAPHEYSLHKTETENIEFYYNGWRKEGIGWVSRASVRENRELIDKYKVLIPKAWGTGKPGKDWLNPFIVSPPSVCTETYLVVGSYNSIDEARNVVSYMQTRFFHVLVSLLKISQNAAKGVYQLVPLQDFSRHWTDMELYEKYHLSEKEVSYIDTIFRIREEQSDYNQMLSMSYDEIVKLLLKKYGAAKHDYFTDRECTLKNQLVSRTAEGLFCHHIDEDKAIMLSNDEYAARNPFEYQKKNRLVYCNLLEHLLLHVKIAEEPRNPDANENELPGIGGAINYLCKQLNDIYAGKDPTEEWRKTVAAKVQDNFDDYIRILRHLWSVIEQNPLYKTIITKQMLCTGWDGKTVDRVLEAIE